MRFRWLVDRLLRRARPPEEEEEEIESAEPEESILSIYGDGEEVDRLLAEEFGLEPVWPREVLEERFHRLRQLHAETGDPDLLDGIVAACRGIVGQAGPGSPDAAYWTTNLAAALRERADRRHDPEELAEAIDLLERVLALFPPHHPHRAVPLSNLAIALRSRWHRSGDPADLDRAIDIGEEALALGAGSQRAVILNNLANALSDRFSHSARREDLDRSIEAAREGLDTAPPGSRLEQILLVNLGLGLLDRSSLDDHEEERDEAIAVLERGARPGAAYSEDPRVLDMIGAALLRRFVLTGDEADLQRSVQVLERALDRLPPGSPERSSPLVNLSAALRDRFDLLRDRRDVERAIAAAGEASEMEPEEPEAWNNLGNALGQLFNLTQDRSDLERAVGAHRRAVEKGTGDPDRALYLNSLGVVLRTRYLSQEDPADLEQAIDLFRRAADEAPPGSPERPRSLSNLGFALELQDASQRSSIAEAHERAAVEGLRISIPVGLNSALRWGAWAFGLGEWQEAARAFGHAGQAAQILFEAQLLRSSQERSLEQVQGLAAHAAYALARAGDAEGAVVALEAGLARLLAQALDRGRIELNRLADDEPDLFVRYEEAAGRFSRLLARPVPGPGRFGDDEAGGETTWDRTAEASAARAELRRIVDEIRRRPGYDGFLGALELSDLQALLTPTTGIDALVYLACTSAGSLALVVTADAVEPVLLEIRFDHLLQLMRAGGQGYLEGAAFGGPWMPDLVPELLPALGQGIVAPVAGRLRDLGAHRVVVVAAGLLGLLPLHAAQYAVGERTVYLLDEMTVSFVPNGASLAAALREERRRAGPQVLVGAGNPMPNPVPLAGAEAELAEISALFHRGELRVFYGADAKRQALLAELPRASHLHLACHGAFDAREPLQSSFALSGGERLTLEDLLDGEVRPAAARLAVLSACQSALTDFLSLPEEVIGFPAGFLQAKVPGVVATLWPVEDLATALLSVRLYELHLGRDGRSGLPPAEALRQAQRWLRTATRAELAAFLAAHPRLREIQGFDDTWPERPFADDPHAWAGFAFYGV